jgi:DNA (cytosine-5)-methyltransferase 1
VPKTLQSKSKSPRSSSTKVDRANKQRRTATLTAIDLFAGAGGFSLAAEKAKLKVLAAVEFDKWAQATYTANFIDGRETQDQHRLYGDILDIEPSDMLTDVGLCKDELDILIGGPPCQGFSSHRLNDAGVDDPRNGLLLRYFDFVKGLRPKVFLVENVSGMLWKRHADYVQRFKNLANDHDYKLIGGGPLVINARDFGVPQSRKRVFILGVRKDIEVSGSFNWPPEPTHFAPNSEEVIKQGEPAWVPASTVFEESAQETDPNDIHMKPGVDMVKRFKRTPLNGGSRCDSGHTLKCHKEHKGHKDVYGRIDPSKPAPTMTTGCINPSKGRFAHPTEHHGITARHAARIQTFPEDFYFKGGLGHSGKQIGNAVPVKLGQYILSYISKHILEV